MKHVFLAEHDFAASGYGFARALRTQGEETLTLVGRLSPFDYPMQGLVTRKAQDFYDAIAWADWVWLIQSDLPTLIGGTFAPIHCRERARTMEKLKGKNVALLHGGGHYRMDMEFYSGLWRELCKLSICYSADLMGGFANEHLVLPPVDLHWFPVTPRNWATVRVGHFPARPGDKGSEIIIPAIQASGLELRTSINGVNKRAPWLDQLRRMSECDVIVDQIKPEWQGFKMGEWVSLATEAAALGRISIANSLNPAPYTQTYYRLPGIRICNDGAALSAELDRIGGLTERQLRDEQGQARRWIEDCHSLERTGEILMRYL